MSVASYDRPAIFRIGRVFGDTFNVFGRNFGLYTGLSLIFSGIPTFIYQLVIGSQVEAAVASADQSGAAPPEFTASSVGAGIVFFLIYMVLSSILQAALVRATIQDLNGQRPTFSDALGRGIIFLLPIVGLTIVMWLGISIGFMLLVIPGIYLIVRWSAAIPAMVHEQRGVFESLTRSSQLTEGSRWRILGLLLVLGVTLWILQLVLGLLSMALIPLLGTVLTFAVAALISAVLSVLISIALAVSYVELRYIKEGADVSELAQIFS
ncbi:hypothetical protein MAUB1S_08500 [Mycolicibacterium aubagnense]